MSSKSIAQAVSVQIRGSNFEGTMQIKGENLSIDLKQFKRRSFYTFQATNLILEKDTKRFLLFKKTEDLFNQLSSNANLKISDENALILPFDVAYKNRLFQLRIQIPLKQRKFNNESQKVQSLFQQVQRLNQQRKLLIPQPIQFRGDQKDLIIKSFEISNQNNIKKIANNNQKTIFSHHQPLKNKGIFYFKIQILINSWNSIYLGICGTKAKSQVNIERSYYFMGLNFNSGKLYARGTQKDVTFNSNSLSNNNGGQIKIEIDMNRKWISWFQNSSLLFTTEIAKDLCSVNIYPMICMNTVGDTVRILDR